MKFDIVSLGDHLRDPHTGRYNQSPSERHLTIVEMGVRADTLGFDAFWVGEHHANKYITTSPAVILAAIAARTRRLRLGSAVTLLPNMDPVRTAEDFATLDLLSKGRAEIGLGSGITEHTFQLFGQKIEDAAGLSQENLELIETLWNEPTVNWKGKYRPAIENVHMEPGTYSGRALPILRATGGTVSTARDAGRRGHKLALMNVFSGYSGMRHMADAYRGAYRESGRDQKGMSLSCSGFAFVRADGRKAKEFYAPYFGNYVAFTQNLLSTLHATENLAKLVQTVLEKTPDAGQEAFFVGEPSEVIEKILSANEKMGGIDKLMVLFDVGGLPEAEVLKSQEIFAEKVMPAVNAALNQPVPA